MREAYRHAKENMKGRTLRIIFGHRVRNYFHRLETAKSSRVIIGNRHTFLHSLHHFTEGHFHFRYYLLDSNWYYSLIFTQDRHFF